MGHFPVQAVGSITVVGSDLLLDYPEAGVCRFDCSSDCARGLKTVVLPLGWDLLEKLSSAEMHTRYLRDWSDGCWEVEKIYCQGSKLPVADLEDSYSQYCASME